MTTSLRLLAVTVLAAVVAGCSFLGGIGRPAGGAYPEACREFDLSARRCEAIVDKAIRDAGIDPEAIVGITLLPFERQRTLGGGQVALVGLALRDGTEVTREVTCIGVSMRLACAEVLDIPTSVGVDQDVPCEGEPPEGCATLPPSPAPDAVEAATPLRIGALDIPLDRLGQYEVEVGTASLPDGYLSERSFRLDNRAAETFWIDAGVRLDVRPDVPGRPMIGSRYRDRFEGPEPVTVFLVFEVTDLDAPSVLRVRDIVVR